MSSCDFETQTIRSRRLRTAMLEAAKNGQLATIEKLTPLHAAAKNGHVRVIELLIRSGSKAIDTPNNNGCTPIYTAASNGHVSAIEALVRLGSKAIDIPDNNGWTPMHVAAMNGHASAIEALVRLGSIAIDAPDNEGFNPLHIAAKNGHASAIEALFRLGSKALDLPNNTECVPVRTAFLNFHRHAFDKLIELGCQPIDETQSGDCLPLHLAAVRGQESLIEELAQLDSTVIDAKDEFGWTALHWAAANGHVNVIEALIRLGSKAIDSLAVEEDSLIDERQWRGFILEEYVERGPGFGRPFTNGMTPMHAAAVTGHVAVIELLVRLGSKAIDTPKFDFEAWTPMHIAAWMGHASVIEALMRLKREGTDAVTTLGWTPMHVAASNGHVNVIETLIRWGSTALDAVSRLQTSYAYVKNESVSDPRNHQRAYHEGVTPLDVAAMNGHVEVVEKLLELGSKSLERQNPLFLAARNGYVKVVRLLCRELGDQIDKPGFSWDSPIPLIEATRYNHPDVIEELCLNGSTAMFDFHHGQTALHFVANNGNLKALQFLLQAIQDLWAPCPDPEESGFTQDDAPFLPLSQIVDMPNSWEQTLLHCAAEQRYSWIQPNIPCNHSDVIKELIKLGSKALDLPDKSGRTPLSYAAAGENTSVVETLVQLGSKSIDTPDEKGSTPMHYAAAQPEMVETLVRLGGKSLDTPDAEGNTPLHLATRQGNIDAITTILRLGSKAIDLENGNGDTPLALAVHARIGSDHSSLEVDSNLAVEVIEVLVRFGSRAIDTPNKAGDTPIHQAAKVGKISVIETLLRMGSKTIDARNNSGCTPLLIATDPKKTEVWYSNEDDRRMSDRVVFDSRQETIEGLIRLGSRAINAPDNEGRTPIATALKGLSYDCLPVVMSLKALGAAIPTDELSADTVDLLNAPVSEDQVLAIRFRVYFSRSLVSRLLAIPKGPMSMPPLYRRSGMCRGDYY